MNTNEPLQGVSSIDSPEFRQLLNSYASGVAGRGELIAGIDDHTSRAVAAALELQSHRVLHLIHERDLARSNYKTLADASPASSLFCPECHMRESMPDDGVVPQQNVQAALIQALNDIAIACNCCGNRSDLSKIAADALSGQGIEIELSRGDQFSAMNHRLKKIFAVNQSPETDL